MGKHVVTAVEQRCDDFSQFRRLVKHEQGVSCFVSQTLIGSLITLEADVASVQGLLYAIHQHGGWGGIGISVLETLGSSITRQNQCGGTVIQVGADGIAAAVPAHTAHHFEPWDGRSDAISTDLRSGIDRETHVHEVIMEAKAVDSRSIVKGEVASIPLITEEGICIVAVISHNSTLNSGNATRAQGVKYLVNNIGLFGQKD